MTLTPVALISIKRGIKISSLLTLWGFAKIHEVLDIKLIGKCLVHYAYLRESIIISQSSDRMLVTND